MAVLQNMWLRGAKKRLGGTVLYSQGGRTLQRELAPDVKNPRTPSQMGQRVKWANLVAFYRANAKWMPKAFENKKPTQSDYNKFVSLNASSSRIYLTKDQARQGACVVDSYKVSDGSLQPVDIFPLAKNWVTNLYLEGLVGLNGETTVADFSKALLASNAGLMRGDQLSFIRITQLNNNTTGIPYVQVRAYELIINDQGSGLVGDFWPIELIGMAQQQETNALSVLNNNKQGGFAIIVSRTQGGKVLVSQSQITLVNMAQTIEQYSSAAALSAAVDSYGKGDEVFLDSKVVNNVDQQPTTLSIVGFSSADGTIKAVPGGELDLSNEKFASGMIVTFNQNVPGVPSQATITASRLNPIVVSNTSIGTEPNKVVIGASVKVPSSDTARTCEVAVVISGATYTASFKVPGNVLGE